MQSSLPPQPASRHSAHPRPAGDPRARGTRPTHRNRPGVVFRQTTQLPIGRRPDDLTLVLQQWPVAQNTQLHDLLRDHDEMLLRPRQRTSLQHHITIWRLHASLPRRQKHLSRKRRSHQHPQTPFCVQTSEPETRRNLCCGEVCVDATQPIEDVYASSTPEKDNALLETIGTTDIEMPSKILAHCASNLAQADVRIRCPKRLKPRRL